MSERDGGSIPDQHPQTDEEDATQNVEIPSEEDLAALERANEMLERQCRLLETQNQLRFRRERLSAAIECAECRDGQWLNSKQRSGIILLIKVHGTGDLLPTDRVTMGRDTTTAANPDMCLSLTQCPFKSSETTLTIQPDHIHVRKSNDRTSIVTTSEPPYDRRQFLIDMLTALHKNGAPSHRLEQIMQSLASVIGEQAVLYYLPTFTLLHFPHSTDKHHTTPYHILKSRGGMNFSKLSPLYDLTKSVIRGHTTGSAAWAQVEAIQRMPDPFPEWVVCVGYPVHAMTSAIMFFHGSWRDAGMSAVLACVPGGLRLVCNKYPTLWYTYEIISCFTVSLIATALSQHFCYNSLILSATTTLLPGYVVTSSIVEIMTKNIISGSVRLA
ncbi:hypothetical protein HK104_003560, partial [Borealophlyctis nickersoniae]